MDWERIHEGTGNYLKIVRKDGEEYADELFSYQEISGFLPLEIRRINGQKEAFYDITGKSSLAEYLREEKFSLNDIWGILKQILELEETLEEYLLDSTGLLLNEEYLYRDKKTGNIWGIYHGNHTDGDIAAFSLLLERIMGYMDQKDRELVFFIYGMHKLTKEAGCTRGELKQYLMEKEEAVPDIHEEEPSVSTQRIDVLQNMQEEKKGGIKNKSLLPVLILSAGILIPVVLWKMGLFTMPLSGKINWGKCVGATAFFLIIAGYGAWRTMPGDKTGVLVKEEEKGKWKICLIPVLGGEEPIPVCRLPFLIGTDPAKTDLSLCEGGISSIHLKILQEDGEIYAADQESAGGTYHNGSRMVPWQKVMLRDGDLLSVGSHEYVVEITSSEYVI